MRRTVLEDAGSTVTAESPPTFGVRNLTAGYSGIAAVRKLTIEVRAGEVVALVGPNGAGKTTALRATVGAISPMDGEVLWNGEQVRKPLHLRIQAGLGYVPEERSIFKSLTVRDNLLLGSGGVDQATNLFPELRSLLGRRAGLLSGGEQQMLALGRVLATQPRALVVDEISLGLAPIVVERLLGVVREFASVSGCAVLLVEQQSRRALSVADRWLLLKQGEMVASGYSKDGHEVVDSAYLGSSS